MDNPAHNKLDAAGKSHIKTIGDLHNFIAGHDLAPAKKSPIMSALKTADRLVGHGALDMPADAQLILQRLDGLSPAMAGMSQGSLANLKSRVREAFRIAEPRLKKAKPNARPPLTDGWLAFQARLPKAEKFTLSRIIHYANSQGWLPEEISDEHIEQFVSHLKIEAMIVDWLGVSRATVKAWNGLGPDFCSGLKRLTPPPLRRTAYWIEDERWPERLRAERDAFLKELARPSSFAGKEVRALEETTVSQYGYAITTLVSAVVADGTPLTALSSMAAALTIQNLNTALMFLHHRSGNRITHQMLHLALKIRCAATWCGVDEDTRKRFDAICENLSAHRPRKGMTEKNRALLDRLEDQRFRDLVQLLPSLIVEKVERSRRAKDIPDRRTGRKMSDERLAVMVRTAVAIELLLVCGLRRENLSSLELGKSIRKVGQSPNAAWVIHLEADEVKNDDPLRFTLPPDSEELLEWYLAEWRALLSKTPGPWLFPAPSGGRIDPKSLADTIGSLAKQMLGVRITPHQFRHLSAELYLRENPEGLFTISQHLGHRDPNTTRTYYVRPKQREASRRYQNDVVLRREEASKRQRSRRPRGGTKK